MIENYLNTGRGAEKLMEEKLQINLTAPNLMCVCIDSRNDQESSGRMYSRYKKEPVYFKNEYQLLKIMEELMEKLNYPQSSVELRSYMSSKSNGIKNSGQQDEMNPVLSRETLLSERGEKETFLIHVKYRQNATWQGEAIWMERGIRKCFRSALELLKLMDSTAR